MAVLARFRRLSRRPLFPAFLVSSLMAVPVLAQEVLVSGFNSGVHRYDFATGNFLGLVGNVDDPLGMVHGPDGHLYVTEEATDKILRFDGDTLAFLDEFVADDPQTPGDENGPLNGPTGVLFGGDGHLYVASFNNDRILRYDGQTGAFLGPFVTAGLGNLNGPDAGMAWGPDGHLYVPSFFNHRVLRYDGETGAYLGPFVNAGSGGLRNPRTVVFRPDGSALVSSEGSNQILLYDEDGDFVREFLTPNDYNGAAGLAVSPLDGDLYVASVNVGNVRRFNGTDGTWEGVFVSVGEGGLDTPVFVHFHPDPYLRLTRFTPGTTSEPNTIRVSGATPGALQVWMVGTSTASLPLPGCPHLVTGVQSPVLLFRVANAGGSSTLNAVPTDDLAGVPLALQVLELQSCRVTNLVRQTFAQG